jgi:succinoglycan biosynthesis protein ExoA
MPSALSQLWGSRRGLDTGPLYIGTSARGDYPRRRVPAPEHVDASVLVPVLNEERHIRETVAAMQRQRFDGTIEFLFMDGRSEDRTRAILEELAREDPRIRVFDNPGRSSTAGLNVGLRHARGDYVVRMDAHTFYPESYVATGVGRLRRGDVDWVAGPQVPYGTDAFSRRVARALNTPLGTGGSARWSADGDRPETELDTGVFAGLWRRDTLERLGGWDEGWPINQDSELAARVLDAGGRIVSLPQLGARYVPRHDLRGLARQYWRYGNYRAKTTLRHPRHVRPRQLFPPALALTTLAAVAAPRPLAWPARAAVAAWAGTIGAASTSAAREEGARGALAMPAIFATMHLCWGFGFAAGLLRFGPRP